MKLLGTGMPPKNEVKLFEERQVRSVWDEGNELLTNCQQLKLLAPDGKMRLTDVADTAKAARDSIEKNIGKSVISHLNAKSLKQLPPTAEVIDEGNNE